MEDPKVSDDEAWNTGLSDSKQTKERSDKLRNIGRRNYAVPQSHMKDRSVLLDASRNLQANKRDYDQRTLDGKSFLVQEVYGINRRVVMRQTNNPRVVMQRFQRMEIAKLPLCIVVEYILWAYGRQDDALLPSQDRLQLVLWLMHTDTTKAKAEIAIVEVLRRLFYLSRVHRMRGYDAIALIEFLGVFQPEYLDKLYDAPNWSPWVELWHAQIRIWGEQDTWKFVKLRADSLLIGEAPRKNYMDTWEDQWPHIFSLRMTSMEILRTYKIVYHHAEGETLDYVQKKFIHYMQYRMIYDLKDEKAILKEFTNR
jgi:hypothetical protein